MKSTLDHRRAIFGNVQFTPADVDGRGRRRLVANGLLEKGLIEAKRLVDIHTFSKNTFGGHLHPHRFVQPMQCTVRSNRADFLEDADHAGSEAHSFAWLQSLPTSCEYLSACLRLLCSAAAALAQAQGRHAILIMQPIISAVVASWYWWSEFVDEKMDGNEVLFASPSLSCLDKVCPKLCKTLYKGTQNAATF
eukprot:2723352-Rhodomonas_salina.1